MSPRTTEQFEAMRVERKQLIEDAALKVFAEDSYHNSSVSKIAKVAGVSKGLMYNYFESKEDLLKTLIRDVIGDVAREMDLPKDRPLVSADIVRFIDRSFDLVIENPQKWKLFMSMFMQKDVLNLMQEEMEGIAQDYLLPFVAYFKENGFGDDPTAAVVLFHSAIDGVQLKLMMGEGKVPIENVKKLIVKLFVKDSI